MKEIIPPKNVTVKHNDIVGGPVMFWIGFILLILLIISLCVVSACGPGILTRERMRQDSIGKVIYIGGVKIVTIDSCEYLILDNGYKGGATIKHKENCKNLIHKKDELSNHEINALSQALGYSVMYAKTESETAEFAMLKLKVDGEKVRREQAAIQKQRHDKKGCPFQYCDSNPPCEGKCKYS